jgi:trimeric autotransporter adhesin
MKTILLFAITLSACFGQALISTVAGNGIEGFSGDGGSAILAKLALPTAVVMDRAGNLYIADEFNNRVRKVTPDGTITTFAGTGATGFSGDGGPADKAKLFFPNDLAIDSAGNLYIADQGNDAIRKVNTSGIISTIAGGIQTGVGPIPGGKLNAADSVTVDAAGNIYSSGANNIVKIDSSGNHTTIAGGVLGFSGDDGPAKSAALKAPSGIAVDPAGNLYFADAGNNRIRKIDKAGVITTIAGLGTAGFSGDGGPATRAQIHLAGAAFAGLSLDTAGNLYFADWGNNRIRVINPAGLITTVAGGGGIQLQRDNLWGDGKPATQANLMLPRGVFVDNQANIYIADTNHSEVRKVSAGSTSTTPPVPSITANGVVNAASLAAGITANSWITILGANLSLDTNDWSNAVVNGKLPTSLDGVSVSVGGLPAYVYYVSPGQINALAPDLSPGPVTVTVTTPNGTSAPVNATAGLYGPAFFPWPGNQAVATRPDYSLVARPGTFPGANTTAAKPGEVIILWGTGFGPTTPAATPGISTPASQVYSTATLPAVTLGSTPLQVLGAALTPGAAGLYQIAVQLPIVSDGTYPIQASIGGAQSPASATLAICSTSTCSAGK